MRRVAALFFFAVQASAWQFGTDGGKGNSGAVGYSGDDGLDIEVVAQGQNESHQIRGSDGDNGREGDYGEDARSCSQPSNVTHDLEGASGGAGGNGGAGGSGGNGGKVTVFYNDIANLKKISISGKPGRGGYGGRGGSGGRPCMCSTYSWIVEDKTYKCSNGSFGAYGSTGFTGSSGSYGQVKIIGQTSPLVPEKTSTDIAMEQMLTGSVTLLKQIWERRSGARTLFGAGTDIADGYDFFVKNVSRSQSFKWDVSRPLEDFKGKRIYLFMDSTGQMQISSSYDVWTEGVNVEASPGKSVFTFKRALFDKEVLDLTVPKVSGTDAAAEVIVEDKAGLSDQLTSNVNLYYAVRRGNVYYQRYYGNVPASALVVDKDKIVVQLGKLGIASEYLKANLRVLVRVYITRKLGTKSKVKQLEAFTTLGATP